MSSSFDGGKIIFQQMVVEQLFIMMENTCILNFTSQHTQKLTQNHQPESKFKTIKFLEQKTGENILQPCGRQ